MYLFESCWPLPVRYSRVLLAYLLTVCTPPQLTCSASRRTYTHVARARLHIRTHTHTRTRVRIHIYARD